MGRSQFGVNLARPATFTPQNQALTRDDRTSGITYRGPSLFVELTLTSLGLRCTLGCGQGATAPQPNPRHRRGARSGGRISVPGGSHPSPRRHAAQFAFAMTRSNLLLRRAHAKKPLDWPQRAALSEAQAPTERDDRNDHRLEPALRCSSRDLPNNVSKYTKLAKKEDAIFSL